MKTFAGIALALLVLGSTAWGVEPRPRPTWTSPTKVARAARDLHVSTNRFEVLLSNTNSLSHLSSEAADLAYGAKQLEKSVNTGIKFGPTLKRFNQLVKDYRTLAKKFRQTVGGSAPWPILSGFWSVQDATFELTFEIFGGEPRRGPASQ